jgi:hypothetical protein
MCVYRFTKRGSRFSVLLLVIATLWWTVPGVGAYEYTTNRPLPAGTCGSGATDVDYYFSNVGDDEWTAAMKGVVNAALNDWELERSNTGAALLDIDEVPNPSANTWLLILDISPGPGSGSSSTIGYTQCLEGNWVIELNTNLAGSDAKLWDAAVHEMGHSLGFFHVGNEDSRDGLEAEMTCAPNSPGSPQFSQDDAAVVQKEFALPGSPGSLHANWGHERWAGGAPRYWTFAGAHTKAQRSGQPVYGGSYSLGWTPSSTASSFYQTVTVTNVGTNFKLNARTSLMRPAAGTATGTVTLEIWTGHRVYGGNPGLCVFPTGATKNQDVISSSQAPMFRSRDFFQPSTAWSNLDFVTAYTAPVYEDAIDVQLRVFSSLKVNGVWAEVRFDNTRIWESF